MRSASFRMHGVSLIEALVALAVMAFGTLAVLGVQTSLRLNADIAKQRGEAVRIAQETLETARSFERMAGYAALGDLEGAEVAGYDTANTTYRVTRTVTDTAADDPADPRRKGIVVEVGWTDRAGVAQSIRLTTVIEGVVPALAGSITVPADRGYTRAPGGRHRDIPPAAIDDLDKRFSHFEPPGSGGLSWTFDNVSGFITQICPAPENCVPTNARLLSGFVRFATTAAQPTPAQAEVPPSPSLPVQVAVARTFPTALAVDCYEQLRAADVRYYCAVPVNAAEAPLPPRWAGRSALAGLTIAANLDDADPAHYRVCRYTPYRDHRAVGTGIPPMRNTDHPLDYGGDQPANPAQGVSAGLTNQNFLVIRAGDGAAAFSCPGDDAATPFVNGNTWRHQPSD